MMRRLIKRMMMMRLIRMMEPRMMMRLIRRMEQRMMIRLIRKMEPRIMMRHLQGIRSRWEFVVVSGGNPGGVVYQPGVPHHTTPRHATPHLVHARDVESVH